MLAEVERIARAVPSACPHCGRPLKTTTVEVCGHRMEVNCWASCGCEESRLDGEGVMPLERRCIAAGVPKKHLHAQAPDAEEIAGSAASGRWVFIHGPYGVGKTRLASCVARECLRMGLTVMFANAQRLIEDAKDDFSIGGNTVDRAMGCGVLVLDDLGKGRQTAWSVGELYGLLDARYAEERPVVAVSNQNGSELLRRLAQGDEDAARAIISRLCGGSLDYAMEGPDMRFGR